MRREGSSDTRKQPIHSNAATAGRTVHNQDYFILPPGMTTAQALAKAQPAHIAKDLLQHISTHLHPSDIDALDQQDLTLINAHLNIRNVSPTTTWQDLPDKHRKRIEELSQQLHTFHTPNGLNYTEWFNFSHKDRNLALMDFIPPDVINYAAYRLIIRHRKITKEMSDLEGHGYSSSRVLSTLTTDEFVAALTKTQQQLDNEGTTTTLQYGSTCIQSSEINLLNQQDLKIIKASLAVTNSWYDLPEDHKKGIKALVKELQTFSHGMPQEAVLYAAYGIVDRHRKLDKEMLDLEGLGFGSGRILALLTKKELARLHELAESVWAGVHQGNIYANEAAAEKALNRVKRKEEAAPKRKEHGSHRRSEKNANRVDWKSEIF
ncbi:hypothetical protein BDR26DRAFT_849546 [Obelidium mucronatum]|nr:hypothetical protein BDR26DRAFT_849546 [Obelidium mucronatum]